MSIEPPNEPSRQPRDALRQTDLDHLLITPEEAEAIFRTNEWVTFEEVMEELNKIK